VIVEQYYKPLKTNVMEQFKKCKVVMLSTENASRINSIFKRDVLTVTKTSHIHKTSKCIYITSDDEIKEGDWCLFFWDGGQIGSDKPQQYQPDKGHILNKGLRKIIATTDRSLEIISKGINPVFEKLPQPSQSFIEKYVEEYNKGNVITDVLVEYAPVYKNKLGAITIDYTSGEYQKHWGEIVDYQLKINSKDSTITIKKVKDSWNREEVRELCRLAYNLPSQDVGPFGFDKWIEENL
jgi:hypothetical protein